MARGTTIGTTPVAVVPSNAYATYQGSTQRRQGEHVCCASETSTRDIRAFSQSLGLWCRVSKSRDVEAWTAWPCQRPIADVASDYVPTARMGGMHWPRSISKFYATSPRRQRGSDTSIGWGVVQPRPRACSSHTRAAACTNFRSRSTSEPHLTHCHRGRQSVQSRQTIGALTAPLSCHASSTRVSCLWVSTDHSVPRRSSSVVMERESKPSQDRYDALQPVDA